MTPFKTLLSQFADRISEVSGAAVAAAFLTYFRSETLNGFKWVFAPLARRLPWNHSFLLRYSAHQTPNIASRLTIADVFLISADGKSARYEKSGDYVVEAGSLSTYFEGVTASGQVTGFSTELGAILETTIEHGFSVSRIDLGSILGVGTRFHNVYRAYLQDCFGSTEEHWTQEIALPTELLILRVHFPIERPPKLIRCKLLVGLSERHLGNAATTTELFGQPAIVWQIARPNLHEVFKLEWRW
jgi:hypothetical protein